MPPGRTVFRARLSILFAYTASANPDRGLVVSDQDGIIQLYGWDVPSGELTQATRSETGVVFGNLSSDGQYIYYLNDDGGNEIGHFARVRSDGQGESEDLTPDMAPYAGFMFQESADGSAQGFTAATKAGSHVYVRQNGGTVARPASHDETGVWTALFRGWHVGHPGNQRALRKPGFRPHRARYRQRRATARALGW